MTLQQRFREEMAYLRAQGREFALHNPQLAQFLGAEASDPDVERLLEGFAFLTARLQQKITDDLPELTQSMLQLLWPNYLRPLPSMTMARFEPLDRAISTRQVAAKGTTLRSAPVDGVECLFRTCADVALYPLRLGEVSDAHTREKSVVRMDLSTLSGRLLDDIDCDVLDVHLAGEESTALSLYLWLAKYLSEVRIEVGGQVRRLPVTAVSFPGFAPAESLLPYPANVFDGYRVLQEYFVFPRRLYGFRLSCLKAIWAGTKATDARIEFHFHRPMPADIRVRDGDLALYCVPAVNLFTWDAEPMVLDGRGVDQCIRPSGQYAEGYEIFSIDRVTSKSNDSGAGAEPRVFHPFESFQHDIEHARGRTALYYRARVQASIVGSGFDHRIALVRTDEREYIGKAETLSAELTCSNRELPMALGIGDLGLPTHTTPSFATVNNITRPTPSYRPTLDGQLQWTLISNLSLNYLSLLSAEPLKAVVRAYDFAALHDIQQARTTRKRLDGIGEATTSPADFLMKGMPMRGLRTLLKLDQKAFSCEGDLYLFATVLSHFFALYASINSFHQLDVINLTNNETYAWPLLTGRQPVI
jgi:type VI secretion system protein ImpG